MRFVFYLLYLPTGECSVETFVFAGAPAPARLLAYAVDSHFLSVHSRYPWEGLASIPATELAFEMNKTARPPLPNPAIFTTHG